MEVMSLNASLVQAALSSFVQKAIFRTVIDMLINNRLFLRVRLMDGFYRHIQIKQLKKIIESLFSNVMSTEIRNWDVVAKAMESAGATSSQMYIRAKALAAGKLDPMPTSWPEAPYSISAVAS